MSILINHICAQESLFADNYSDLNVVLMDDDDSNSNVSDKL